MKVNSRSATAIACAVAAFALGGCANMTPQEQNKATGQIVGGVTGAALGSLIGGGAGRTVAIASGAVIGTVVGGQIGSNQK
jgi:uncharacterized protein YcfJ